MVKAIRPPGRGAAGMVNPSGNLAADRAEGIPFNAHLRTDPGTEQFVDEEWGKDLSNIKVFRERACSKERNWEYLLTTKEGKNLTKRQAQVLHKLASGHTNKAIAEHLGLSVHTVRAYVSGVLRALDVSNRTQAALIARELLR